jgi:peptide deformylase
MSVLKVIRLGHPALRARSRAVTKRELKTKRFQKFLDNLAETCIKSKGVGIAAPQVNVNKRVIVVHVDPKNPRYPDKKPFPLTVVINPKVIERSKQTKEDWEGDLSAGIRALIPRSVSCVVTGLDREGKSVKYHLENDFHARVFQHEIDHLDGKLFIDKVKRKETISETREWKKYWKDQKLEN